MYQYLYALLLIYFLPELFIAISMFASDLFQNESAMIPITVTLLEGFAGVIRDALGVLLLPMMTAYSIRRWEEAEAHSQTRKLLWLLIGLCMGSIALYGIIGGYEPRIAGYDSHTAQVLKSGSLQYVREVITYIGILLGISGIQVVGGSDKVSR